MAETMTNASPNQDPDQDLTTQPFTAEVGRVLEIVINSLYKEREIFLRELVSNASDACDKLRYQAIAAPALLDGDPDLKITISADTDAGTLIVADNGIGMDRQDLIDNLGTIARSGTARFLDAANAAGGTADLRLIGQFGVGFYAAFMVADRVTVETRKAGQDQGFLWESDGKSGYTIATRDGLSRGTSITLHLKDDAKEFLDEWKIRGIIRTYSDHIAIPIVLASPAKAEKDEEAPKEPQQINEGSALWSRPRAEISDEQYREFYHHVAHSFDEPFARVHFTAEGTLSYTGLLFVPGQKPFDLYDPKRRHGVKLYVRRVFITDELAELMPRYLRFVSGVVDSEDLQLNVSRETLQHGPVVARMRKVLAKRVLDELAKKAAAVAEGMDEVPVADEEDKGGKDEQLTYAAWWSEFGAVLKEGLYEDQENRSRLLELARFKSTRGKDLVTLADYVGRMKDGQDSIYYISGESAEALRNHPQLEEANAKGVEVLLMDDPVDEFWLGEVRDYEGKSFKSLTKGEADLSTVAESEAKPDTGEGTSEEDLQRLTARLKTCLGDAVKDVRVSKRLRESAVCLVAEEHGLDMRLERLLKQHRELSALGGRILEINGKHDLVRRLAALAKDETKQSEVDELAKLLLDQARIIEGEPIPDPGAFSRRMSTFLAKGLAA